MGVHSRRQRGPQPQVRFFRVVLVKNRAALRTKLCLLEIILSEISLLFVYLTYKSKSTFLYFFKIMTDTLEDFRESETEYQLNI